MQPRPRPSFPRSLLRSLLPSLALLAGAADARAQGATVPLATGEGGIAVYYNATGGETPSNVSYFRAQFSATNANGSELNFLADPIPGSDPPGPQPALSWYALFQAVPDQFGFDLVLPSTPTSDGSVPAPALTAYENGNNSLAGRIPAGPVTWAISGYSGPSTGPANPASGIINSLFRGGVGAGATTISGVGPFTLNGDGVQVTMSAPIPTPGGFEIDVSGVLTSDGLIHWYTLTTPDSPVSNYELTGRIFFSGTLEYATATDVTVGQDFYAGTVDFEAEVICGTRYVEPTGLDFLPAGPFLVPNNCRTEASPCLTVAHATELRCPADLVQVGPGTPDAVFPSSSLVLASAMLRPARGGRPVGAASVMGSLDVNDSGATFQAKALANQLAVRIQDAGVFDVMVPITGCVLRPLNSAIVCRSADRKVSARFLPSRADGPYLYRTSVSVMKLPAAIAGTTVPVGPVDVTIQEDVVINRSDRIGNLTACVPTASMLRCRER